MNIPIVLNQCHFMDYHGTLISGSPSSSISDQMTKTFGETEMDLFERIADLNNIEKYLPKIFDSDVPDGFIKILNRLKSSGGDPSENLKRFKKEFEKLQNIDFAVFSLCTKLLYIKKIIFPIHYLQIQILKQHLLVYHS